MQVKRSLLGKRTVRLKVISESSCEVLLMPSFKTIIIWLQTAIVDKVILFLSQSIFALLQESNIRSLYNVIS